MEMLLTYLPQIATGAGALLLVFLTPFATKYIEKRYSRRPAFSLRSPVLRGDLRLKIEPANSRSRKRKPLGVTIRGLILPNAGKLDADTTTPQWTIDLSDIDGFSAFLKEGDDYSFQFFFDIDSLSEPVLVRYVGDQVSSTSTSNLTPITVRASSAAELIRNIKSSVSIHVDATDLILNRAFPSKSENSRWESVHDGHEFSISNVSNLEIAGNARILSEPRYAWVINFRHCHSIAIRGLTIGHTDSGYCRGGVLRFESCSNIVIEECDLFGCGTYGIELQDCEQVEIYGSKIRDCTYGIANIFNSTGVTISSTQFMNNLCFDAFDLKDTAHVLLKDCKFSDNKAEYSFFGFHQITNANVYINNSTFEGNSYPKFSNAPDFIALNDAKFINESVGAQS